MKYKFDNPIHGTIGDIKYQCTVKWRNGQFIADEPVTTGVPIRDPTLTLFAFIGCLLHPDYNANVY